MKPSYTKEQRERAKREGLRLCTISTPALTVTGPFTKEEAAEVEQFLHDLIRRRCERHKAEREKEAKPA